MYIFICIFVTIGIVCKAFWQLLPGWRENVTQKCREHDHGKKKINCHQLLRIYWVQLSSDRLSCPTLCNPVAWSKPGFPVLHQLTELAQTHVHRVSDAIQPFHPLSSPSPPPFNISQHQGLLQWVSSLQQGAKILELQLQHQSFQWMFRTDFF